MPRRRFGRYEAIDFLAVRIALCDQWRAHRWREFSKHLQPFAIPFMALFDRDQLPSRSALSRFLAALTEAPVEALRTLLTSRFARAATHARQANRKPDGSSRNLLGGL